MPRSYSTAAAAGGVPVSARLPSSDELRRLSARLERAPAASVVEWAVETFGDRMILAASFQDCVLIDIATRVVPGIEVVFLDTGFHFPETLTFVETVAARYALNLRVMRPDLAAAEWPCGSARCCELRKVEPLARALEGRRAWMSGVRRVEAPTRAMAPIVAMDHPRRVVKVNPLATWTDVDVAGYIADHDLPRHPLAADRYLSIGCAPATTAVPPGAHPRSGRWSGNARTECGLHT